MLGEIYIFTFSILFTKVDIRNEMSLLICAITGTSINAEVGTLYVTKRSGDKNQYVK